MKGTINNVANFNGLTAALVALLAGIAIADELDFRFGQLVVQASIVVILAVGLWSFRTKPRWYFTRAGLLIAIGVVTALMIFVELAALPMVWLGILLLHLLVTARAAFKQVMFTGSIDSNKIVGSVCIFLLAGLIWATAYLMIAHVNPSAFNNLAPAPWYQQFSDLVYYSFVTLTTLGYGYISPATPIPRFLAVMEAIFGQFYIAVLVASLVGARMSEPRSRS